MNLIKELYQLQEQKLLEEQQMLMETADQILTQAAAQLHHGKSIFDINLVKGLGDPHKTGLDTLAKIFAGVEAVILHADALKPEAKPQALTALDKAENKTNDKFSTAFAITGEKARGGKYYKEWTEKLQALLAAYEAFRADPNNTQNRDVYMTQSKEMEAHMKKLSLELIKTRAQLEKDIAGAGTPANKKDLDFTN